MKNYIEFCNEQTEKLFQIIDTHEGLLKWQKSWKVKGSMGLPKSVNGYYRGINLWNLLLEQANRGLVSDTWLTYNQVKQQDGHVLKGAKGTQVCFFKLKEVETDEVSDNEEQKVIPLFRMYTVFNLDQTSLAGQSSDKPFALPKLHAVLNMVGVALSEFGNQPCYKPMQDVIVMPKREFFVSEQDYEVTLLHELVHAVGHPARLDRKCAKDYAVSDVARAEEELVAEIGSVFLASYFGISGDLINHASYVFSWKKLLDAKTVGRAMSQASKAFAWIVDRIEGKEVKAA